MLTKRQIELRSQARWRQLEIDELREDIAETERKVLTNLQKMVDRSREAKFQNGMARLSGMAYDIEHNPAQMTALMAEANVQQAHQDYQSIIDRYQAKQAAQQQAARNQIRKNGIWPVEY